MTALAEEIIYPGHPHFGGVMDGYDLAAAHNFEVLTKMVDDVYAERRDPLMVARFAIAAGFLLIGCIESQEVHYPVGRNQHAYHDQRDDRHKHHLPRGKQFLRAGANVEEALACALWGDYNSRAERIQRCRPFLDVSEDFMGWGRDMSKTDAARKVFRAEPYLTGVPLEEDAIIYINQPGDPMSDWLVFHTATRERPGNVALLLEEEAFVKIHARPEYIAAAVHPLHPLTGAIDLVPRRYFHRRIRHEIGQWVTEQAVATSLSIPITGIDLTLDRIATQYIDTRAMTGDSLQRA